MAHDAQPSAPTVVLSNPWRVALAVDAILTIIAGLLWTVDSTHFVRSTFAVASPDGAHLHLALKGGLPLLWLGGVYYLLVAVRRVQLRSSAIDLQFCLAAVDVGMLALGVVMLREHSTGEPATAAIAQIVVAAARIVLRGAFWRMMVTIRSNSSPTE